MTCIHQCTPERFRNQHLSIKIGPSKWPSQKQSRLLTTILLSFLVILVDDIEVVSLMSCVSTLSWRTHGWPPQMQKATRPGWVPIHWADMEWCCGIYIYIYTYRYVSKYTSVDLCFLYIIHLREKKSLLPIMPIYIYITYLAILCFPDMTFSSSPKSHDKSHSPPHHVCCSHPPRQIPNVHYLGALEEAKSSGRWWFGCPSATLRFQTAAVGNGHQLLCGPNVILAKNSKTNATRQKRHRHQEL